MKHPFKLNEFFPFKLYKNTAPVKLKKKKSAMKVSMMEYD